MLEIYYEAPAAVTASSVVAADVLEAVLSQRLFLTIREQLGASYTATAWIDPMFCSGCRLRRPGVRNPRP